MTSERGQNLQFSVQKSAKDALFRYTPYISLMYQAANTKSTLKIKPHSWQVIQAGKSSCSWGLHWGPCEQLLMGTPLGPLSNCSKERTVSCTQIFLKLSKRCRQHTQCVCRHNNTWHISMYCSYERSSRCSVTC